MSHLLYGLSLALIMPIAAIASPIDQFTETPASQAEAAPCYLKTTDGRSFDLSRICGRSAIIRLTPGRAATATTNASATTAPIVNPNFRAAIGANPGNPFGPNPNVGQCYIVDADGNACQ
jgi:hypothetical protein